MMKRLALVVLVPALLRSPAHAAGWERPAWNLRLGAISSSDLFQDDSLASGQASGVTGEIQVETSVRSRGALKWSFAANGGGLAYARVQEANRAWLGGTAGVRRGGTQLVTEIEWTPRRVKFPAVPEDAAFERHEWRAGLRQAAPRHVRVTLEGRFTRDDYVTLFDGRDARERGGYGQVLWNPTPPITLRAHLEIALADAAANRYDNRERESGAAIARRGDRWRFEAGVNSGVRRYTRALPLESNYRRRDQWIGTELTVGRRLTPAVSLVCGATTLNQTSSRLDRAYDARSFQLGFEWNSEP